jgi:hypothetical protein
LLGQHIFHRTFGPNYPVTDLLFTLSNPDLYRHLSGSERCTPDSFFAVTAAVPVSANGAEGSTWKAEGTAWAGDVSCSGVSRLTGFAGRSPFSEFDAGGVRGFGYGTESSGSLSPADAKFGSQPARACTLADVHATFRHWLGSAYDLSAVDAVLATGAAARVDSTPSQWRRS